MRSCTMCMHVHCFREKYECNDAISYTGKKAPLLTLPLLMTMDVFFVHGLADLECIGIRWLHVPKSWLASVPSCEGVIYVCII